MDAKAQLLSIAVKSYSGRGRSSSDVDGENYYIRDGVVVVPKGTVIPAGAAI